MIFWPFPGWPEIGHFEFFLGVWGFGRVSIEFPAPLTFIWTKFQPEKCHMGPVPTISHDFHESGMYPRPSETAIYRSNPSGNTQKVLGPSPSTSILRKLAFRPGKTACFFENCHFA